MFLEDEEDHISQLPMEILALIMSYLNPQEIKALSEVSKLFQKVRHSEYLWRLLLRRDHGIQCEQLNLDGSGIMASAQAYQIVKAQNQEFKNLQKFHPQNNLGTDSYEKFSDEQGCLGKREAHLDEQNESIIKLYMSLNRVDQGTLYLCSKISRFPRSILNIWCQPNYNIRMLYLTKNHLSNLSSVLFDLPNLQLLSLADNDLCEIPPHISKLTCLTSLSFGNNRLTGLPVELFALTNLNRLEIGNRRLSRGGGHCNKLEQLPVQLGELTKLCFLDLTNLGLQTIPGALTRLQKLRILYMADNPNLTESHEPILALKKINSNLQVC